MAHPWTILSIDDWKIPDLKIPGPIKNKNTGYVLGIKYDNNAATSLRETVVEVDEQSFFQIWLRKGK